MDVAASLSFSSPMTARAGRAEGPREETSLMAFVSILLIHRRVIAGCALAGMILFGVLAASQANLFLSRASFLVSPGRVPIQLPGGAPAIRAFAAPTEVAQSIVFYSDLVRARSILIPVAERTYRTSDGRQRTLAQIYGIEEKSARVAATRAAARLVSDVSSTIYPRSGIVGFTVRTPDPLLSQQIAASILAELNLYATGRRRTQVAEERRFIAGLLNEAKQRLDQAEIDVSRFLLLNREYDNSPQLRLAHDRLTRNVMMQQEIYTALSQSYEQARIDEASNPTVLSIVEPPDLPVDPQQREAVRRTLLGLAAGSMVGVILAFILQRHAEKREV